MSMLQVAAVSRSTTWVGNSDGVGYKVIAFVLAPTVTLDKASRTFAVCDDGAWREVGRLPEQGRIIL